MTLRQDIQVLRGLAVLLVLLFHANLTGIKAGYLGVDIFYVLSGFLITSLIARKKDSGTFALSEFYIKRAKRLLPVAYVVYIAVAIMAFFFLADLEYNRFQGTLIGAITFTANIDLWQHTNYFSPSAKLNPLTHTWSLSIEEQYYLLMPFTLILTPRRYWLAGAIAVFILSLALCLYMTPLRAAASFYLLPTRAWEMALGSVVALMTLSRRYETPSKNVLTYLAIGILLWVPFFSPFQALNLPYGSIHPGLDALTVCFATAYLLTQRAAVLEQGEFMKGMSKLGDISYSLYLVHWPLFAFAANAYLGEEPPLIVRLGLLILSVLISIVLYRTVENPVRKKTITGKNALLAGIVASVFAITLSFGLQTLRTEKADATARMANKGLGSACDYSAEYRPKERCQSQTNSRTLVWGDSFAMHLVPGLAEAIPGGVIQATRSSCGPILNVGPFRAKYSLFENFARGCIRFNQSVFDFLARTPEIEHVILSSPYQYYVSSDARGLIVGENGDEKTTEFDEVIIAQAIVDTVSAIRGLGKSVSIIGPTPTSGFNVGLCHARKAVGAISFGRNSKCQIDEDMSRQLREPAQSLLKAVSDKIDGGVIDLAEIMCHDGTCPSEINGTPLYLDGHHFSVAGSKLVVSEFNLTRKIENVKR